MFAINTDLINRQMGDGTKIILRFCYAALAISFKKEALETRTIGII